MNNGRGKPHTLDGRTQPLNDWAREFNIPNRTVRDRLKQGIDLRTALSSPRGGDGYLQAGRYGVLPEWREWVMAPVITENNLT